MIPYTSCRGIAWGRSHENQGAMLREFKAPSSWPERSWLRIRWRVSEHMSTTTDLEKTTHNPRFIMIVRSLWPWCKSSATGPGLFNVQVMVFAKVQPHVAKVETFKAIALFVLYIGLGLEGKRGKKNGLPSPRAEEGQENIETVHEPEPIQTVGSL